eukprot:CAMPEP_0119287602 /NCGR_PEP_ID=MMETSP1329-20130426/35866_1 /TAXON_ID=114041 /ORGANISM="Genus nov. species nov., Strain RCC1024" /LENGTH=103 /DNA_ID=CAMNT_0007288363 /DNA_START=184 /DNA_END=492 /DNA_ORIENTATION=-
MPATPLGSRWLPTRVLIAIWDFIRVIYSLENRRVYDLLSLLVKIKRHGRLLKGREADWNVLREWRKAVREAPDRPFVERAEADAEGLRSITYGSCDVLSDGFA